MLKENAWSIEDREFFAPDAYGTKEMDVVLIADQDADEWADVTAEIVWDYGQVIDCEIIKFQACFNDGVQDFNTDAEINEAFKQFMQKNF